MFGSYFNPTESTFNPSWNESFSSKLDLSSSTSSGGGGGMFPAIAGGLISAGGGIISGLLGSRTQASAATAQLKAQADQLKQGILFQRDAAKAQMGAGLLAQVFGSTTAPDLEFGRQAAAQRLAFGEFMPKQLGLGREEARWQAAFENSADMKEKSRRERIGRLQESIAQLRATPTGMFGRIAQAPIESLMV